MKKTVINRNAVHMKHLVISSIPMTTITLLSNHTSQDSNEDIHIHNWKKPEQLVFRTETRPLSIESLSLKSKQHQEIRFQQTQQETAII